VDDHNADVLIRVRAVTTVTNVKYDRALSRRSYTGYNDTKERLKRHYTKNSKKNRRGVKEAADWIP
jgi:hypothetical protein